MLDSSVLLTLVPPGLEPVAAALLIFASFFTSAAMAALGVGGGLMMLSLMASLMPIAALIPVHGMVQLGSNAGRAVVQRTHIRWGLLVPFLIGSVVGAVTGGMFVVTLNDAILRLAIGLFILYAVWGPKPNFSGAAKTALLSIGGLISTFLTMFFGATGPFAMAIAQPLIDQRQALVGTHAAMMTIQHILKLVVFGALGFAFGPWLPFVAAMIATGFLGTLLGLRLLAMMPEQTFRTIFKWAITILALDLIRRGVTALMV
ncbi:MAG: sulfite exporter TauE/SafE family protein [Pseudomonadota bacterium]